MTVGQHQHRLISQDGETRRGECSICGPVYLIKAGRGYFACGRGKEPKRRVPTSRRKSSGPRHSLSQVDDKALTATCSVCGPGTPVRTKRSIRSPGGSSWYCVTAAQQSRRGTHGLTGREREAFIKKQGERCAICGTDEPGGVRGAWAVDHCHETGEVRGILCFQCNVGIGCFGDDIRRLRAAMAYLATTQASEESSTNQHR